MLRREARALAKSSRPIAEVARSLSIAQGTLWNWVKADRERHERDANPDAPSESKRAELKRLHKENVQLAQKSNWASSPGSVSIGTHTAFAALKRGPQVLRTARRAVGCDPSKPAAFNLLSTEIASNRGCALSIVPLNSRHLSVITVASVGRSSEWRPFLQSRVDRCPVSAGLFILHRLHSLSRCVHVGCVDDRDRRSRRRGRRSARVEAGRAGRITNSLNDR